MILTLTRVSGYQGVPLSHARSSVRRVVLTWRVPDPPIRWSGGLGPCLDPCPSLPLLSSPGPRISPQGFGADDEGNGPGPALGGPPVGPRTVPFTGLSAALPCPGPLKLHSGVPSMLGVIPNTVWVTPSMPGVIPNTVWVTPGITPSMLGRGDP